MYGVCGRRQALPGGKKGTSRAVGHNSSTEYYLTYYLSTLVLVLAVLIL